MTDDEAILLEKKFRRWEGKASLAIMPAVLVGLMPIPLLTLNQQNIHPILLVSPVLLLFLVLALTGAVQRWETETERRIDDHYKKRLTGTRWTTPAGAEGIVIAASDFGRTMKIAFPSGAVETYEAGLLSPAP